jgi:tRNA/rRNA methyltransferase
MEIVFILLEPARPENIGASARALKTMGFTTLRLVRPCDHLSGRARALAHASDDILEAAEIFPSFEAATADTDFIIGCTAKRRTVKEDYYRPAQLRDVLEQKGAAVSRTAVVFGREESGLSNEELDQCHISSRIIMRSTYPSLNLSQAVMIYAYELSPLVLGTAQKQEKHDAASWRVLHEKIDRILRQIGIGPDTQIYRRILERSALLGETDLNLLHSITEKLLRRNEEGPKR